jgi:hypothetical protein
VRRIVTVLVCAVSAATLAACSSSGISVQRAQGVTAMVSAATPSAVMEASFTGTLTTTDQGCLAVSVGETTFPLKFPAGSRLSDDGQMIDVPGFGSVSSGELVEGGGGYLALDGVPDECAPGGEPVESIVWQSLPD